MLLRIESATSQSEAATTTTPRTPLYANLQNTNQTHGNPDLPGFPRISRISQDFPEIPGFPGFPQDFQDFPEILGFLTILALFRVRKWSKNDRKVTFFEKNTFFVTFLELAAPLYWPKVLRKARTELKNVQKSARGVPVFGKSGFYPPDSWWAFVTFSP